MVRTPASEGECAAFRVAPLTERRNFIMLLPRLPEASSYIRKVQMLRLPRLSYCILLVFALALSASAEITWTVIDYPGAEWTMLNGIHNKGDVVGVYHSGTGHDHGFLLSGGVFTTIDFPGAFSTNAEGINDDGDIVGTYAMYFSPMEPTGFVLHAGTWTTIQAPGRGYTWVHGINNAGDIVGESQLNTGTIGFVRKKGASYSRIVVPGAASTWVKGINNTGDIVGYFVNRGQNPPHRGYLLRNGVWQLLDLPDSYETEIDTVNDYHQIAGQASSPLGWYQGFVRYNDQFLIVTYPRLAQFLWVTGVNNQSNMVGYYYHHQGSSGPFHGIIRTRQLRKILNRWQIDTKEF